MISEHQLAEIADKVNSQINIPMLSEKKEAQLFLMALKKMETKLEQLLRKEIGDEAVVFLQGLLDETMPHAERVAGVEGTIKRFLSNVIVPQLNERLDLPFLDEEQEAQLIDKVLGELAAHVIKRLHASLSK